MAAGIIWRLSAVAAIPRWRRWRYGIADGVAKLCCPAPAAYNKYFWHSAALSRRLATGSSSHGVFWRRGNVKCQKVAG